MAVVRHATGRYTAVAVVLHWLMALAIVGMLLLGLYMTSDLPEKTVKFQLFQLHKSVGITLLWLIAVRIAWRLTHRAPDLNGPYSKVERVLATLGHIGLYILMVAMPLSGWLLVSSSPLGLPTLLFGTGIEWPHLPGVAGDEAMNNGAKATHYWLAWIFIVTIAGHIAAVAKHWLVDRENILVRMWFPVKRNAKMLLLLIGVTGALVLAANAAQAKPYTVDYTQSKLAFSGIYADKPFNGVFKKWTAAIDFDAAHPAAATIEAVIETASATTGETIYDRTLPDSDWFNIKTYPQATFKANGVATQADGSYLAHGMLTIRGQAKSLDLAFTLVPADGNGPTLVSGMATLQRLDYGIGAKSDATAEWVGREIKLALTMQATPQN